MRARVTIVIARYKEDISWAHELNAKENFYVVLKEKNELNVGREAETYLAYMLENYHYHQPEEYVCFVQGEPHTDVQEMLNHPEKESFGEVFKCDGWGHPSHGGLPISRFYHQFSGKDLDEYVFRRGACFAVKWEKVQAVPYYKLLQLYHMNLNYINGPWIMERLWGYIFNLNNATEG